MSASLILFAQTADDGGLGAGAALIGALVLLFFALFALVFANFILVWLRARAAGAPVSFVELVALRLRKVPVSLIVDSFIVATRSGLNVRLADLATHHLAGGNVPALVKALAAAREAGVRLDFDRACAIDLASKASGKSIQQAVDSARAPRTLACPDLASGQDFIEAATSDGIRLKARASLTVRGNLDRFIGAAAEETIVPRLNEAIAVAIRSLPKAREALGNPERISEAILRLGLDKGSGLEILSLNIQLIRSS